MIKFCVHFPAPTAPLRAQLWQQLLPPQTPLAGPLDFQRLGQAFQFTGARIRNCVYKAAGWAAVRLQDSARRVGMPDLLRAAQEEVSSDSERVREEVQRAMFF